MNFRPYDILTQLIPGVFVLGYFVFVLEVTIFKTILINTGEGVGHYTFVTVCSFIVGYLINGFGHILQFNFPKKINDKVFEYFSDRKRCIWLFLFKPFTKLKYKVNKKILKKKNNFQAIFNSIETSDYERIKWLNQDKKFARSLLVTSLILILCSFISGFQNQDIADYSILIYAFLVILFILSVYRYIQTSIDYSYWVLKLYERKMKNK